MWYFKLHTENNKDSAVIVKSIIRIEDMGTGLSYGKTRAHLLDLMRAHIEAVLNLHGYSLKNMNAGYTAEVFIEVPSEDDDSQVIVVSAMRLKFFMDKEEVNIENEMNWLSEEDVKC